MIPNNEMNGINAEGKNYLLSTLLISITMPLIENSNVTDLMPTSNLKIM